MKITYNLNTKDYIDFNLYHIQYSKNTKKKLNNQRIMGAVSFVIMAVVMFLYGGPQQTIFSVLIIAFAIFWYVNFPNFAKKRIKKSTEKAIEKGKLKDLFKDITIEINEVGLKEINLHGEHDIPWSDVIDIVYLDEYVYTFLRDTGAMVVPIRVLEEGQLEQLKSLLEANFEGEIKHLNITLS